MDKALTQEQLKVELDYSPDTGIFTWLRKGRGRSISKPAGGKAADRFGKQYVIITVNRVVCKAHHLAILFMTGKLPKMADHADGDGCNNRWANLSESDPVGNSRNRRKPITNTSGHVGVCPRGKKWEASIMVKRKTHHLGTFEDFDGAVTARKAGEVLHGFHANHGQERPL